ncbi:MAG: XdhC family protein, partial [Ottowia sp.]|nr:XdhC family protein [Ottowia sp.]
DEAAQVVVIFGAGRVAQEVARQAAHVGFAVDVLTARPEEAAGCFPTARRVVACPDFARATAIYPIDARHYAVILTRSHEADLALLRLLLATPARYLGVMGAESEKEALFADLRAAGCPAAELACVRCPIGVPVGAQSPEELGIAIAAELVAARSGNLRPNRSGKR